MGPRPEWVVLIISVIGMIVSGYLLVDAILDRLAVKELEHERGEEPILTSFTRARGIAETIRFTILLLWVYVAVAVISGNDRLREIGVWVLVVIPTLITASSIHSWIQKRKRNGSRSGLDVESSDRG